MVGHAGFIYLIYIDPVVRRIHKFHPIHGDYISLSTDHTEAVVTEDKDSGMLFSRDPLQSGDRFTVKVIQIAVDTIVSLRVKQSDLCVFNVDGL